jgi:esterase/lipase
MKRFFISVFVLIMTISATVISSVGEDESAPSEIRTMKYSSRSAKEAIGWQHELRTKFFALLKMDDLIANRRSIPLDSTVLSSKECDGYTQEEIEFRSTPSRRGRMIKAVLTTPDGPHPPYPAVICIHGHGGNRYSAYDSSSIYKGFATELARQGYITISIDIGQHEVYERRRTLMGERLWDLIRCVDYLHASPIVDKGRIGCAGLSLGGEMSMWLGAIDRRVSAVVSAGFLTVMDQMEQNHCMCWKFPGLRELVDFADIYSMTAPRALQCQNGLKEPETQFYVPLAKEALQEIKVIYKDFDALDNLELDIHQGAHEIDLPELVRFLGEHLKD